MRWLTVIATATLLAVGAPTLAAAAPDGADAPGGSVTIALLESGDDAAEDPRADVYITDHLAPGQTVEHRVRVTNDTGAAETLELYAGPASLQDGDFTVADREETNLLTEWVSFGRDELVLGDGQSEDVTVTVAVPDDAPEGEQYGVIWASTQPRDTDDGEVQVVSRVGVRMYVSVGPGGAPAPGFTVAELQPGRDDGGDAIVSAAVDNTGGRAVDLTGELALTDGPGGLTAQTVTAKTTTLAPGESGTVVFTVPDSSALPAGPWHAAVTLESGHLSDALDAQLTFPADGEGQDSSADGIAEWVWVIIAITAALAIAGVAWAWTRRRTAPGGPSSRGPA